MPLLCHMFSFTFGGPNVVAGDVNNPTVSSPPDNRTGAAVAAASGGQLHTNAASTYAPQQQQQQQQQQQHFSWSSPLFQQRGFAATSDAPGADPRTVTRNANTATTLGAPDHMARLFNPPVNTPSTTAAPATARGGGGVGAVEFFTRVLNTPVILTNSSSTATLATTVAAGTPAWPLRSCPPLSAKDVVSTFTIVEDTERTTQPPLSGTTVTSTTSAEAQECAICLELLMRASSCAMRAQSLQTKCDATAAPGISSRGEDNVLCGGEEQSLGAGPAPSPDSLRPDTSMSRVVVREVYCGHRFHEACILQWISGGNYTCPLCRAPLVYE